MGQGPREEEGSIVPVSPSHGIGASHPPSTSVCSPIRRSIELQCAEFLYGISSRRYDWVNNWLHDWNQSPTSLPSLEIGDGLKISTLQSRACPAPPLNYLRATSSYLVSINLCVVQRSSLWITTDIPVTQEVPREFETLLQELGTKTRYTVFIISQTLRVYLIQLHSFKQVK